MLNEEVDRLIEAARKESDQEKRKQIYTEAQELEMKDAVFIPVRVIENVAAVSKNVDGFRISAAGYLELNDVSIK
jgi:peptide/nickel transport system substrate-binding protein